MEFSIEQHKELIRRMNTAIKKVPTFEQLKLYFSEAVNLSMEHPDAKDMYLWCSGYAKKWLENIMPKQTDPVLLNKYASLYWDTLKFESPYLFDSYMRYLEKNRDYEEKFYEPRRKSFLRLGIVQAMQSLEDDELDLLTLSLPPGTG